MNKIHVLEFGSYLAGPLTCSNLVSMGCKVTCIIRPKHVRGAEDEYIWHKEFLHDISKNKTIIELDLKKDNICDLIKNTDIIVQNFAPGVAKKLKIDVETCQSINPRIIYVSLPGYSTNDAKFGSLRSWDSMIMASSGVFRDMGLNRTLLGIKASYSSLPMPSVYAAIFATLAIVAACHDERWGEYIEIPLGSALSEALIYNSMDFPCDDIYMNERELKIKSGDFPINKKELESLTDPFFSKYTCRDKRPFYLVCPSHARHQLDALDILDIKEHILSILPIVNPYSDYLKGIGSGSIDFNQSSIIKPLISSAFLCKDAFEWEELFGKGGVPAIAHRTINEWICDKHTHDSGLITYHDNRIYLAPMTWLTNPRPITNHNNKKYISEMCILDMTNVIAGPTIGTYLARYGANVIKIDPPLPNYSPEISVIYGLAANIGKHSILLNINEPSGRKAFNALISKADAILINCTNNALKRSHIAPDDLYKINPDLILARFDAWGGPLETGYLSEYVGYDDNVQAGIGIMERFGGCLENAEEHAHIGTIDVIAGVAAAAGVINALYSRKHDKIIHISRTSLASVGQYIQYPLMFKHIPLINRGLHCIGEHKLNKCYETNNGWIIITAVLDSTLIYKYITLITSIIGDNIEHELLKYNKEEICEKLNKIGIGAMPLCTMKELRKNNKQNTPSLNGNTYQFITYHDHPIGTICMVAPLAIRSSNIILNLKAAPKYGQDTKRILSDINCLSALLKGAAILAWSRYYLPYFRKCDICHNSGNKSLILYCNHNICNLCTAKIQNGCCPICKISHNIDIIELRLQRMRFISGYSNWRKGGIYGSNDRDMPNKFPISLRRIQSSPDFFITNKDQFKLSISCISLEMQDKK